MGGPSYVAICKPWSGGNYHPSQTILALRSQAQYSEDECTIHFFLLRNARQAEVIPRIPAHHESQIVGSGDFSSGEEKRPDCESTEILHSSMGPSTGTGKARHGPWNQPCCPQVERDHWLVVMGRVVSTSHDEKIELWRPAVRASRRA